MIEVDGKKYTEEQAKEAIEGRNALEALFKTFMEPCTCNHEPRYAGGACAACHAYWIQAAERAEKEEDIAKKRFAALLTQAMEMLCAQVKCTDHKSKDCPGQNFAKWALFEIPPSTFVGRTRQDCVECHGSGDRDPAADGPPCLSCGGSGRRDEKGPFYRRSEE